jgi:ankyrin repeat protein
MPPKRQAQVSAVELQQEHRQDQESTNKRANSTKSKKKQQQQVQPGLNVNCKQSINLPPPPLQDDNPIITQFKPRGGQWGLNDENIKRIDSKTRETILHNYCKYINTTPLEVYRFLIETMSCDVNAQDNFDETPIYHALCFWDPNYRGDIAVLQYLLTQMNINVNTNNNHGNTLLHRACDNINNLPIDVFKLLIETMGCDVNAPNNYNQTPIHLAFHRLHHFDRSNITVFPYLLSQKGVNGNIKDNCGDNLLHMACQYVNRLPLEIFQHLIEKNGCDVNAQNKDKDTPLHLAFHSFDPNKGGDITVLTYLLSQKGVNANINGKRGYTLLHYACERINKLPLDIFKLLIETVGCDVNAQNTRNDTPLHDALLCFDPRNGGDITVLTYLLSQEGINANIKNQYSYTVLHRACQQTNKFPLDIFETLIEKHGADVNVQNTYNDTPLHLALDYFDPNNGNAFTVLSYLINQKDVNVKIRGNNGCNLLHTTCMINPSNTLNSAELNAECDTMLCQVVEFIAERCLQEVFEEKTPLEATTTM